MSNLRLKPMPRLKIKNLLFAFLTLSLVACTQNKSELGSKKNPIKFYLVPAQDIMTLTEQGKVLKEYLAKDLGLEVELELPTNYVAVVEAFGSKRADVAILNTLGYVLAHEKYGAEAKLKLINRGRDQYYGQIIVRHDGPKTLKELNGKKFAFVDPTSVSGYLLPQRLFKQEGITIKESVFAGKQDTVVTAVYQKQVDGGATFYTPPDDDGTPKDARWLLRTQYPDIYEKVKILQLTDPIPNNPVVFRKDIPEELKTKIIESLKKYIKTPEGAKVMMDLYHITEFREVADKDYDMVRQYLKDVGMKSHDFVQ
ncbi:phosphate/phosphite/phosphonate ABC transporter substrate-binding protein [Pseudobdellovibrio exovorus]|nr:phosphate/phosphite/phosphonate ABC transporter substrate-binding protein [Pseudobdellovibrio exovorus]